MMLRPGQLFWIRLRRNYKEQARVWKSVFDWTVWIYLLVPAIVVGGGLYRDLWRQMPEWGYGVSWSIVLGVVMFLFMMFGGLRTFLDDADRLFLLQRPSWVGALRSRGMLYSVVKQWLLLLIPVLLLLPFLVLVEQMDMVAISIHYSFSALYGAWTLSIGHLLGRVARSWRYWLMQGAAFVALAVMYGFAIGGLKMGAVTAGGIWIALVACAVLGLAVCAKLPAQFEEEVKSERKARMSSTELLMSQALDMKPASKRKSPLLFRRSQRLFRSDDAGAVLAELRLKAFMRSMTPIQLWLSFLSISAYATALVPVAGAYLVVAGCSVVGLSWLSGQWKQWMGDDFVGQYRWSDAVVRRAVRLSRFWLLLPHMTIWSAIAGYKIAGMWAAGLSITGCVALWALLNRTRPDSAAATLGVPERPETAEEQEMEAGERGPEKSGTMDRP